MDFRNIRDSVENTTFINDKLLNKVLLDVLLFTSHPEL